MANQALDSITSQEWERCIHHVEKIMLDVFDREVARDRVTENFIINLSQNSDSDSDSDSDSNDWDTNVGEK